MWRTNLGTADLHMHSKFSDGSASIEKILSHAEKRTNLNVIAITDHDCIAGAQQARDLCARHPRRAEVIVGVEVSTSEGHLLALNIETLIPSGMTMGETIQAVHEQGGLAIVAHPLKRWCPSASLSTLCNIMASERTRPDGLEVVNASFGRLGGSKKLRQLNDVFFHVAETGSSDAHCPSAIGSSRTYFPGSTASDLLNAIRTRTTLAYVGGWPTRSYVNYGLHEAMRRL